MGKQVFYQYDPATGHYTRVFPSRRRRLVVTLLQFMWGAFFGAAAVVALYYSIDFPRERAMRRQAEATADRLEDLQRRTDRALAVMQDIAARDNNFYRVVLQAEPLGDAARYAGLERERRYDAMLDSLPDAALLRSVTAGIDRLDYLIYHQIKSFDFLRKTALKQTDRIAHIPAIQPVSEKSLRQMASGYGYRRDPIYGTSKFHEGMDFAAAPGTPVYATGQGKVLSAGWHSGYGNLIEVDHGYGYLTRYAHLSKIDVKPGQSVSRGDKIGEVGNTGKSTGPHLHYEVRLKDVPQNPVNYYFMDLSPAEYDQMIRQAENAGHVMD